MSDFRRPTPHQNGSTLPSILDDPDRWTIPEPPQILLPTDEALLLHQLLATQKEQLIWSQRTPVMVREIRDIPFWSLVKLFVKAAFAAIPAAIIIAVIWAIINAIIAGTIAALLGLLLIGATNGTDAQPTPAPRAAIIPQTQVAPTSAPIVEPPIGVQPNSQKSQDLAYIETMGAISKDFTVVVGDSSTLLKYFSNDNSLLEQPKWNEDIKATYPKFRDVIARIRAIEPASRFQKSHSRWLEFATYLENAINAMEIGIPARDAAKLEEGNKNLSNAKVAMEQALEETATDGGL